MSNIAIIPARGGSKRIPRKNIKDFLGKPIIAYSIEAALQSGLFDEVMVSTEDEEIATIAKQYGAKVPFLRSEKNADDFSGTVDVLLEVCSEYDKSGKSFDNLCCIYPTAPLLRSESLIESHNLLISKSYDTVFPVCQFSFPILRALQIDENKKVSMIWPENMAKRSQDLPSAFHDAGQFYWAQINIFKQNKKLYSDNSGVIILEELEVQDIDNVSDWKVAEFKFQLLHKDIGVK